MSIRITNSWVAAASFAAVIFITSPVLAQEWAREKLEKSPRHGEWVEVKHGDRNVRCFLVFPEVKEKAAAVVVVQEIFGLTEWVRSVADQLAEAGYIAIAPDLLSGQTVLLGRRHGLQVCQSQSRSESDLRLLRSWAERSRGCGEYSRTDIWFLCRERRPCE